MIPLLQLAALLWLLPSQPERYDVIELRIEYQTSLHLAGDPPQLVRTITDTHTEVHGWNNDPDFGWAKHPYWYTLCERNYSTERQTGPDIWSIQQAGEYTRLVITTPYALGGSYRAMESRRWVRHIVHEDLDGDGAMKAWLAEH